MPLSCQLQQVSKPPCDALPDMIVSYPASLRISGRAATRYSISCEIRERQLGTGDSHRLASLRIQAGLDRTDHG